MIIIKKILNLLKINCSLYPFKNRGIILKNEEEFLRYIKENRTDWYVICEMPIEISCDINIFDKVVDIIDTYPNGLSRTEILERLSVVYCASNRYSFEKARKMRIFSDDYIKSKIIMNNFTFCIYLNVSS